MNETSLNESTSSFVFSSISLEPYCMLDSISNTEDTLSAHARALLMVMTSEASLSSTIICNM